MVYAMHVPVDLPWNIQALIFNCKAQALRFSGGQLFNQGADSGLFLKQPMPKRWF